MKEKLKYIANEVANRVQHVGNKKRLNVLHSNEISMKEICYQKDTYETTTKCNEK